MKWDVNARDKAASKFQEHEPLGLLGSFVSGALWASRPLNVLLYCRYCHRTGAATATAPIALMPVGFPIIKSKDAAALAAGAGGMPHS
jgi:hypothetical protein